MPKVEMTPEQIAAEIRYARDVEGANPRDAFLALADLAVSMLHMIDARRESGIKLDASYNENMLRIAVELLATQEKSPENIAFQLSLDEIRALVECIDLPLDDAGDGNAGISPGMRSGYETLRRTYNAHRNRSSTKQNV